MEVWDVGWKETLTIMVSHMIMGMLFPLSLLTLGNVFIRRQHSILFSFSLDTHLAFPLGVARVVCTQRSPKTQSRLVVLEATRAEPQHAFLATLENEEEN